MKTLIITVGTRQVGWRCQDGVVRSLGADGGSVPPHVDELYQIILEQPREVYPSNQLWGVRHLAEQLYTLCELNQDFTPVEFLLDQKLIDDEIKHNLTQIVLWGTHQPEEVSWKFRRLDTLWSAELMAGKLRQIYPGLQVEVWCPVLSANDAVKLCQNVEEFILQKVLYKTAESERDSFRLLIENKGSTPAISSALEMCAVALSRQCQVNLIVPQEPDPSFLQMQNGFWDAQVSKHHTYLPIGRYFWPLEKPQIISTWQRGDFSEARLWLAAHRDRYKVLYDLSEYLVLSINGDIKTAVKYIKNHWINCRAIKKNIDPIVYQQWLVLAETLQFQNLSVQQQYAWIWERTFLFELALNKKHYSNAFLGFAQVLEALLNLQYETEDWLARGYLTIPENIHPKEYSPALGSLIKAWEAKHRISEEDPWHLCLDGIRKIRNKIAHEGVSYTEKEVLKILLLQGRQGASFEVNNSCQVFEIMQSILTRIAKPSSKMPQDVLLRSLYVWGLDLLEAEQ